VPRSTSTPAFRLVSSAKPLADLMLESSVIVYVPLSCWVGKPIVKARALPTTGLTVKGPLTSPAGPWIRRTLSGVNVDGFMVRSNVTTNDETVPLSISVLGVPGAFGSDTPPGTLVLTTCGPGTISGKESCLYGAWNGVLPVGVGTANTSPFAS